MIDLSPKLFNYVKEVVRFLSNYREAVSPILIVACLASVATVYLYYRKEIWCMKYEFTEKVYRIPACATFWPWSVISSVVCFFLIPIFSIKTYSPDITFSNIFLFVITEMVMVCSGMMLGIGVFYVFHPYVYELKHGRELTIPDAGAMILLRRERGGN